MARIHKATVYLTDIEEDFDYTILERLEDLYGVKVHVSHATTSQPFEWRDYLEINDVKNADDDDFELYFRDEASYSFETVTVIHSDWDYSPVIVHSSENGILLNGDNMHNVGFEDYAEGYAEGAEAIVKYIHIQDEEELEEAKDILVEAGMYKEYLDVINES